MKTSQLRGHQASNPTEQHSRNSQLRSRPFATSASSPQLKPQSQSVTSHIGFDPMQVSLFPPASLQLAPPATAPKPAAASAPPKEATLKISWSGKFGGKVKADVVVFQRQGKKRTSLDSGSGTDTLTLKVPFHDKLEIQVTPTDTDPDDRYKKSKKVLNLKSDQTTYSVSVGLPVNRWNLKNVKDVWEQKDIDPDKAAKVKSYTFLGHKARLNEATKPRVDKTNQAFSKLSAEDQAEITNSIIIIGGYAKRTTSKGGFSNHSIGCSLDVNYNMGTKQNYHFHNDKKRHKADVDLMNLVQTVVRTNPAYKDFDIWKDKGMRQLEASQQFNLLFPQYLARLIEPDAEAQLFEDKEATPGKAKTSNWFADWLKSIMQAAMAKVLFSKLTAKDIDAAIKKSKKGSDRRRQLEIIRKEWTSLKAWVEGAVPEGKEEDEKLVGMIPLNQKFLKLMLDSGWQWGGDWTTAKDYMHFEDKEAFEQIKK
ncbi:M15 family metallopeptidase [Sphaerothrix gracilis]|uniref:M15 family metallopeptidase n=1 Tax=Sphaerothrix gracilis TaxID=3151835 RepID=UPI0031FD7B85